MTNRESIAGPLVAFVAGLVMVVLGLATVGLVILGGEPLTNLIRPPFWMLYGLLAAGLIMLWKFFRSQAEIASGSARTR